MADWDVASTAPVTSPPDAWAVQSNAPQGGAPPSLLQTVAASPLGRLFHDAVMTPVEGVTNFMHPVDFSPIEKPYANAIAAQQNRPGYADARAQANAMMKAKGSGFQDQVTAPLNSALSGLFGLVTGGVNGMNATADAQGASQQAYQKAHPISAGVGQALGGMMAMPEGTAARVPTYVGDNPIITRLAQGPNPTVLPNPAMTSGAQSIAQVNAAKKAAYQVVDNSPMKIAAPGIQDLHSDLMDKLSRMGLTSDTMPTLTPKVATAMDSLYDAGASDQTLQAMDIQRRVAGIAAGSLDKTERTAARIVQDGIDDFITNLQPNQLSGPADPAAISALPQARDLASRSFKAQQIQDIMDKAANNSTGFSQSGYENSLRNGFRNLLNNPRGISRFNPGEVAAIKQVATGGSSLSATNLMRQVGKLSPQGAVPILAEIGAYGAFGPQALAIPAAGIAGRTGATLLQQNAAKNALNLALNGAPLAAQPAALGLPAITSASRIPFGMAPFGFPLFANQAASQ